jgi:hypothetical protein
VGIGEAMAWTAGATHSLDVLCRVVELVGRRGDWFPERTVVEGKHLDAMVARGREIGLVNNCAGVRGVFGEGCVYQLQFLGNTGLGWQNRGEWNK